MEVKEKESQININALVDSFWKDVIVPKTQSGNEVALLNLKSLLTNIARKFITTVDHYASEDNLMASAQSFIGDYLSAYHTQQQAAGIRIDSGDVSSLARKVVDAINQQEVLIRSTGLVQHATVITDVEASRLSVQAAREAVSEGKRKSETKAEKMNTARAELNAVLDKIGFLAYDQDSNIPRRELRSKIGNLVTFWY